MISEKDDHIPPAPEKGAKKAAAAARATSTFRVAWGDRALSVALGLLLGFTAAYLYLERRGGAAAPPPADPHAAQGFPAGATRDLPGSGGGAPVISMDPGIRQRIAELEAALARDPRNGELLVQLGNAGYDGGDFRLAVDAYEKSLGVRGDDPNVLTDLGTSYRNLGDLDKAVAMFDRALKVSPSHWQAAYNKIVVLGIDKGETAKAKELLAKLKASGQPAANLDQLEKMVDQRASAR